MSRQLKACAETFHADKKILLFDGEHIGFYQVFPAGEVVESIHSLLEERTHELDPDAFFSRLATLTRDLPGLVLPKPVRTWQIEFTQLFDLFDSVERESYSFDGMGPGMSGCTNEVYIRLGDLGMYLAVAQSVEDAIYQTAHELTAPEQREPLPDDLCLPWLVKDERALLSRRGDVSQRAAARLPLHVLRRVFIAEQRRPAVREAILHALVARPGREVGVIALALGSGSVRVRLAGLRAAAALGAAVGPVLELICRDAQSRGSVTAPQAAVVLTALERENGVRLPGEATWRRIAALCPPEWSYRLPQAGDELRVPGPVGVERDEPC